MKSKELLGQTLWKVKNCQPNTVNSKELSAKHHEKKKKKKKLSAKHDEQ